VPLPPLCATAGASGGIRARNDVTLQELEQEQAPYADKARALEKPEAKFKHQKQPDGL
jgi:hypothetical protein